MIKIQIALALIIVALTFVLSIVVAMIPAFILRIFGAHKAADKWMRYNGTNIAKIIMFVLHTDVTVIGKELIPEEGAPLCFIANHQSMLDIPIVLAKLGIWVGFIAKSELKKVPILNVWIRAMNCVYIDRKSPRSSIEAILQGVKQIQQGTAMFIFPEGTRSKTGALGTFKTGSLKLATRAKAIIVPITIDGTRDAFEHRTSVRKTPIRLSVSEPIDTATMSEEQLKDLPEVVFGQIQQHYQIEG
ncbi:MAG: lysophospholipid acyltransferase family protein [Sphaerochaetaceae bacterium]|jgi:1-acyl-sn-glycerol-3-phosphate acyltransferase